MRQHNDSHGCIVSQMVSPSHRQSTVALATGLVMTMALGGCMTVDGSAVTRVSSYGPAISYSLWTAGDLNQTIRPRHPANTAYALGHCRQRSSHMGVEQVECK